MRTTNSSSPIAKTLFLPCLALCLAGNAPIQGWQHAFAAHHLDRVIQLPATKILVVDFKNDKNPYYVIYGKSLLNKTISTKNYIFLDDNGKEVSIDHIENVKPYTFTIVRNSKEPAILFSTYPLNKLYKVGLNKRDIKMNSICWPIKNVKHGIYAESEDGAFIQYFNKKWDWSPCGD